MKSYGVRLKIKRLSKLYIFVNNNTNKDCKCSTHERVQMLKLMLADIKDKIVIIPQLSTKKANDYSTIKGVIDEKLINIVGEDSYEKRLQIPNEDKVEFDAIAIIPRQGSKQSKMQPLEDIAFYLSIDDLSYQSISSTVVRNQLKNRTYANIALDPEVLGYVVANKFYQDHEDKKELFLRDYFAYVGEMYSPFQPPIYDPGISKNAWKEKIQKWVYKQQTQKMG